MTELTLHAPQEVAWRTSVPWSHLYHPLSAFAVGGFGRPDSAPRHDGLLQLLLTPAPKITGENGQSRQFLSLFRQPPNITVSQRRHRFGDIRGPEDFNMEGSSASGTGLFLAPEALKPKSEPSRPTRQPPFSLRATSTPRLRISLGDT